MKDGSFVSSVCHRVRFNWGIQKCKLFITSKEVKKLQLLIKKIIHHSTLCLLFRSFYFHSITDISILLNLTWKKDQIFYKNYEKFHDFRKKKIIVKTKQNNGH